MREKEASPNRKEEQLQTTLQEVCLKSTHKVNPNKKRGKTMIDIRAQENPNPSANPKKPNQLPGLHPMDPDLETT